MASAIERLLVDRELAARLGRQARRVARVRHDPARIGQQLLEVYRELVERGE
jgi:glycosyltransferase involved in cell wall biosynthesis